jgi:hypothetical protein
MEKDDYILGQMHAWTMHTREIQMDHNQWDHHSQKRTVYVTQASSLDKRQERATKRQHKH